MSKITVHVEMNKITGWYEVHSHGMDKIGQSEIKIECPALFIKSAANIIHNLAEHFSKNKGSKLLHGERIAIVVDSRCEITALAIKDPECEGRLVISGEDVEWTKMC